MSKKKPVEEMQPDLSEVLKPTGKIMLTAASRAELAEMVDKIAADCKYAAGAVGFDPATRLYCIRLDIIPAKP
jgi:hypothetical protein